MVWVLGQMQVVYGVLDKHQFSLPDNAEVKNWEKSVF